MLGCARRTAPPATDPAARDAPELSPGAVEGQLAPVRVAGAGQGARAYLELRALDRPLSPGGPSSEAACDEPGNGWHRHAAELEVPATATILRVTLAMVGEGKADFDAVELAEAR